IINDEWKDITINITNNEVILSEDDFTKLINRTNQLEIFQAEINQKLNNKIDLNTSISKTFHSIYNNLETTQFSKNKKKFTLSALQLTVDIRNLPAGYHSSFPPTLNKCDACKKVLVETIEGNKIILICGHGYHLDCYKKNHNRCEHCIQYYKKGIFENVKSFIERLESTQFLSAQDSINLKYLTALNDIHNW
ncbi:10072_t:CDS:2, partial [Dentiscutata heterogama]